MSDELSDDQIALLCAIGDQALPQRHASGSDLETLLGRGYAELTSGNPASSYRLTAKGIAFLSERGVGLNEA